jgi:hypothetical protein
VQVILLHTTTRWSWWDRGRQLAGARKRTCPGPASVITIGGEVVVELEQLMTAPATYLHAFNPAIVMQDAELGFGGSRSNRQTYGSIANWSNSRTSGRSNSTAYPTQCSGTAEGIGSLAGPGNTTKCNCGWTMLQIPAVWSGRRWIVSNWCQPRPLSHVPANQLRAWWWWRMELAARSKSWRGGGGGGGRGNAGNAGGCGGAGGCGVAGTPATFNCVPVTPGGTAPITVGSPGGQIVISWNPQ